MSTVHLSPEEVYGIPTPKNKTRNVETFANESRMMAEKMHAKINEVLDQLVIQARLVEAQEIAIVMLKEYIVKCGLPAYWDKKDPVLTKPIKDMTVSELIARNSNPTVKYKHAFSKDVAPMPTFEELEKMYKERNSPKIATLVIDTRDNPSTAVYAGQTGPFMDEESSAHFSGNVAPDCLGCDDSDDE